MARDYAPEDVRSALAAAGVAQGDVVYLSTQLFGLGPMNGAASKDALCDEFYGAVRDVIGPEGTLVVPTFTQQVGRYGLAYIHEDTQSLTGIFGEHVRNLPGSLRSLHPVFSVSAIGPRAREITQDISGVAFGRDSAFDRLYRIGGKSVCIGFAYYSGHITALMHYVETAFAVPYYYSKLVLADVFQGGRKVERPFAINVKYLGIACRFDYCRYIDALDERRLISAAELGRGMVYCVDTQAQIDTGFDLLRRDIYAFLAAPPAYIPGQIPCDGPVEAGKAGGVSNWSGFLIGV